MNISEALKVFRTKIEIKLESNPTFGRNQIKDIILEAHTETLDAVIMELKAELKSEASNADS